MEKNTIFPIDSVWVQATWLYLQPCTTVRKQTSK